jgi:hypothetical protein
MTIGGISVNIPLEVIKSPRPTLLLGMDWNQKYNVILDTQAGHIGFESEGQRYQTAMEYEQEDTCYVVEEMGPRLELARQD